MSEQKHTPGAWELWQAPTGEFAVRTTYTDDQGRRTTTWPAVCNAGGQPNEANARLISAAPEMLEALIMVRDADEDCKADGLPSIPPAARAKIDTALAKVEGRQP